MEHSTAEAGLNDEDDERTQGTLMDSLLILGAQTMGWACFLLIDKRQPIFRAVVSGLWAAGFFCLCFGLLIGGLAMAIVATWLFIESRNMVMRWEAQSKESGRDSSSNEG